MRQKVQFSWRSASFSLAIAALAAACFNNWVIGYLVNQPLLAKGGLVSELSVTNQPYSWLFRSLDIVAGILFVTLAALLYRQMQAGRLRTILIISVIVLGVANSVDAALPLHCSETLSANCHVPVNLSLHHFTIPSHGYSSVIIAISYFVIPFIGSWYSFKHSRSRWFQLTSLAATFVAIWSFTVVAANYLDYHTFIEHASGPNQGMQMILLGLWFISWQRAVTHPIRRVPVAQDHE